MTLGKNDSKIPKPLSVVKKRTLLTNICKVSFDNRTIEKINLFSIFHGPLVKAALPNTSAHFENPTMVYNCLNQVWIKIRDTL